MTPTPSRRRRSLAVLIAINLILVVEVFNRAPHGILAITVLASLLTSLYMVLEL